jgi:hypothetical protein
MSGFKHLVATMKDRNGDRDFRRAEVADDAGNGPRLPSGTTNDDVSPRKKSKLTSGLN